MFKALNKTRGLYLRWQEITKAPTIPNSPEAEWTSTELRNALRSIEWDLEDLEDTINILLNYFLLRQIHTELLNRLQCESENIRMMKQTTICSPIFTNFIKY